MWRFLNEQVAAKQRSDSSRGVYVFSDLNPYVGHPNPLKEGQDLFRKGLLSEAVLALEAEVLKNPENAEGWRLLGIAHAENDDDQQVRLCLVGDKPSYLCRLQCHVLSGNHNHTTGAVWILLHLCQLCIAKMGLLFKKLCYSILLLYLSSSDCSRYRVNNLCFQFYLT